MERARLQYARAFRERWASDKQEDLSPHQRTTFSQCLSAAARRGCSGTRREFGFSRDATTALRNVPEGHQGCSLHGCSYTSVKGISESLVKVLSTQKHASLDRMQGSVTQTTLHSCVASDSVRSIS